MNRIQYTLAVSLKPNRRSRVPAVCDMYSKYRSRPQSYVTPNSRRRGRQRSHTWNEASHADLFLDDDRTYIRLANWCECIFLGNVNTWAERRIQCEKDYSNTYNLSANLRISTQIYYEQFSFIRRRNLCSGGLESAIFHSLEDCFYFLNGIRRLHTRPRRQLWTK